MNRTPTAAFLCTEAAVYVAFLFLDLTGTGIVWSTALKYASVLLCFALACFRARNTDGRLVCAALGFTLLADLFLLVLNRWYLAGVCVFCVVQGLYLVRLLRLRDGRVWFRLLLRALLALAALIAVTALGALEPLTAVTALYFSQLVANGVESLILGRRYALFSVGLLLFICCDLCVGLQNLSGFLPVEGWGWLFQFARVGMWLFYLPSQVLIALSSGKE